MSPRKTQLPVKSGKTAAAVKTVKTAAAKPRAATAAPARTHAKAKKAGTVAAADRQRFIAEAAYFKAERRGFAGGSALQDWLEAEAEIDALLASHGAGQAAQ